MGSILNYSAKLMFCAFSVPLLLSCESEATDQNASSRYRIEPALVETRDMLAVQVASEGLRSVEFAPWVFPYENPFGREVLRREWIFTDIGNDYFRITSRWIGDDFSIAIANDGVFDKLQLAPSSEDASQRWKLTPLENGFCTITNEVLGEEIVLDSDTTNPEQLLVVMHTADESAGQQWEISQIGMGGDIDSVCSGEPF